MRNRSYLRKVLSLMSLVVIMVICGVTLRAQTFAIEACSSDSLNFIPSNLAAGNTYLWQFGDGNTSTSAITKHAYDTAGVYSVILTITDAGGCMGSDTLLVSSHRFLVDAGPDGFVIIKSGGGLSPKPTDTLMGSQVGAIPPFTWAWTPVSSLSSPSISNPISSPVVTTLYTLTVTDDQGCSFSDQAKVVVIDISNTDSLPIVGNNDNKVYVCHAGTTITVNVGASCSSPASLCYHLLHGDPLGPCPGAAKWEDGVPDAQAITGLKLDIVPNPANPNADIVFSSSSDATGVLEIVTDQGVLLSVLFDDLMRAGETYTVRFAGEMYSAATFLVRLRTNEGTEASKRLVLVK